MNIKAMQKKVEALRKELHVDPTLALAIEEWATIQCILCTTKMCETCRAFIDQALAQLAGLKPAQGGYSKQQYQMLQDTICKAFDAGCRYAPDWDRLCKYAVADALWKEGHHEQSGS